MRVLINTKRLRYNLIFRSNSNIEKDANSTPLVLETLTFINQLVRLTKLEKDSQKSNVARLTKKVIVFHA